MQRRRGIVRLARGLIALLVACLLVTGCTATPPGIRFAAFGDSITASTDRLGLPTHWTWVATASTGDVHDVGGYRHYGDTTADILAGTQPIPDADVAVVMAGTNDAPVDGEPDPRTLTNIEKIFDKAGVPRRILSAVAPRDDDRAAETLRLNEELRSLAARSGWTWVDPWTDVRTPDGRWRPGTTVDGIHPTPASGHAAGVVLRAAIVRAAPAAES
ncbi:SGNH/GDSL hydrolase family protein [Leifsonia shinshuensis]|uniref:SGNH/GDSL hydrolase family protein n=1 Tax=Leifsonia shinshuensis TaxID=150026 RepID=UPI00285494C0|nr:SGNH/GDSL hydrolase family protein [Leifsonia shinshuensis]MDR6970111.1 lysophospholipase L1-like esterase [Leifsonia shinshuensis]